jgi:hypothetical protein
MTSKIALTSERDITRISKLVLQELNCDFLECRGSMNCWQNFLMVRYQQVMDCYFADLFAP